MAKMKASHFLYLLAFIRLLLPFLLQHPYYQLHRDEFLYLDYAKHMDWGYMEVPPLLSIFSWISMQLGHSFYLVKFWPALFGALTFLLCGKLILHSGGGWFAILLLFISLVFGAFIRVFYLFQPGFLEIFFWTAITYAIVRFQQTQDTKWLYYFGMACGLGMLSKYTTAFFITGMVAALLFAGHSKLLFSKNFLKASLLALLIFLPNLVWQYVHKYPIVNHMEELRETQLIHMNASGFLAGQLMMNFIVSFVWITGLIAVLFLKRMKNYRWVGYCFLIVITLLMLGSGKDYYALGLYPILFSFGAFQLESATSKWYPLFRWSLVTIPFLAGLFILPLGLPMFKPQQLATYYEKAGFRKAMGFTWEDQQNHPLPQDFADMIGWRELAEMTAKNYQTLPDSVKEETVIYCRGYYTAGALNFYGKKLGLPEAISDNGSYLLWFPAAFNFKHLMLIGHSNPGPDDIVFNHFEYRRMMDSLSLPLFRETGIKVWLFQNAKDSMQYYASKSIAEQQQKFKR